MNSFGVFVLSVLHVSLKEASCANILIAYDLLSPSHQLWNYALAEGLIHKGHNITMIGPFADKQERTNAYHPIIFEGVFDAVVSNEFNVEETFAHTDPLTGMKVAFDFMYSTCNHLFRTNGLKSLMNYPKDFKFDLIIIDMTASQCLYPLIQRFRYPPTIGVTAFPLAPHLSETFGNDIHPSYLPFYRLTYTDSMSFLQRVENYVLTRLDNIFVQWYQKNKIEELAKERFGENMDSLESLERRITILLCNLNLALFYPQPLTPNIIPVGGLHVKKAKSLPEDLQAIMDNAKDGVILLSLGTNIRWDHLSAELKNNVLSTFGKLKQAVIWKFETELDDVPKNVVIRKWIPQNDVLGHPNLRLFISHGGALSSLEAAYHGVPIIGMPFFIDQLTTVSSMVGRKLALQIDFRNLTSQELLDCINEILQNPVYSRNIKEISNRMRDQPQTPLERAVFWAEYAIRHNGASFLNPKSRYMSVFASSNTDVFLFLMLVIFSVSYIIFAIFKSAGRYLSFKLKTKQKIN